MATYQLYFLSSFMLSRTPKSDITYLKQTNKKKKLNTTLMGGTLRPLCMEPQNDLGVYGAISNLNPGRNRFWQRNISFSKIFIYINTARIHLSSCFLVIAKASQRALHRV